VLAEWCVGQLEIQILRATESARTESLVLAVR
jgi:hypothetical protein